MPIAKAKKNDDHDLKPIEAIQKPKEWHKFSPELARLISPEQPDIAGAILLYGIWLWTKNNYKHLWIDGKRHAARSLSELAEDHPYFTSKAIEKIINRLDRKGALEVRRDRKKLHFSFPEVVNQLCAKRKGHIWFRIEDAVNHGERAAVLLANLQWQIDRNLRHIADEFGTRHYPLEPQKLSHHLPISRWTITRTLRHLAGEAPIVLKRHPQMEHHYTRVVPATDDHVEKSARAGVDPHVAGVEGEVAEVGKIQKAIGNRDGNRFQKWFLPTALAEAAPSEEPSVSSPFHQIVREAHQKAAEMRQAQLSNPPSRSYRIKAVTEQGEEYEYQSDKLPDEALPYDIQPDLEMRESDLNWYVEEITEAFHRMELPITIDDQKRFRRILFDNPHLAADDLLHVLASCLYTQREEEVRVGVTVGDAPYLKVEHSGFLTFPRRVRSAWYFLERLPEILKQLGGDEPDERFEQMNFSYLGEERVNGLVQLWRNPEEGRDDPKRRKFLKGASSR